jgi:hypothetical protein
MLSMKTVRFLALIFLAFLAATLLAGCVDENVRYIQGNWANGDVHFYSEWVFDRGSYIQRSTITTGGNSLLQSGSYRISESKDNLLVLELYDKTGGDIFDDPSEVAIVINREADSLRIGRITYYRVVNRTLEEIQEQTAP